MIVYSCPACKVNLPYDKAFIENGMMFVKCPKCKQNIVVDRDPRCPLCMAPATNLKMVFEGRTVSGTNTYRPIMRCDLHEGCDHVKNNHVNNSGGLSTVFKCHNCNTITQHRKTELTLKDAILHAVCPKCGNDCVLQKISECDFPGCKNSAVHCVRDKSMTAGYSFRCDQHKESKAPGCFIATAACGDQFAPYVSTLQNYRDSILRRYHLGRKFIRFYETVSPPIARYISSSRVLKFLTRVLVVYPSAGIARVFLRKKS